MLDFQNLPPDDPRGVALPLKRCPPGKGLTGIVTSDDLIGCATHYYHGRTHPCTLPECPAHDDGVPWRWHSYLAAWNPVHKIHFVFESTARATEPFVQYRKANSTLRGCAFTARRINTSPNARVLIETRAADLSQYPLPAAPNLLKVMSIIWNIPLSDITLDGVLKDVDRVRTLLEPNEAFNRGNTHPRVHDETVERKPA